MVIYSKLRPSLLDESNHANESILILIAIRSETIKMAATIKENVYPQISQLKLRPLTKYDVRQFREFMLDSKESISTFIEMGRTVSELTTIEFLNFYSQLIKVEKVIHYGVFHGWKMLAYASYGPAFDPNGLQIVYFVRNEYLKQNIGTFTLGKMTTQAWLEHDVHFVQAVIDKVNIGSRKIAKSQGFEPLYALTALGQGTKASDTQICYIYINPKLKLRATVHNMRAIDLIGHFAFIPELEHLIHDQKVNEFFQWKYPIYVEDDLDTLV